MKKIILCAIVFTTQFFIIECSNKKKLSGSQPSIIEDLKKQIEYLSRSGKTSNDIAQKLLTLEKTINKLEKNRKKKINPEE
jgi:hypothetical protein